MPVSPTPSNNQVAEQQMLARKGLPARGDLRRFRHQLRAVQRGRRAGRAAACSTRTAPRPGVALPEVDAFVWHGFLPNDRTRPALRLPRARPYDPAAGHRCNPNKLLLDPYAKAIDGTFEWDQSLFGYNFGDPDSRNDDDSAASMPKSVVINPFFDWGIDRPPQREYADSCHLRGARQGLTQTHPDMPDAIRGTYAAIGHPAIIEHLEALGVTAIELMPVHHFVNDSTLIDKGLTNYWGYNTIGFFAPDAKLLLQQRYARRAGAGVQGDGAHLHEAGIEVILDVVYNHTAEGNHLGPTLSMRGIDNAAYYRLVDDDKRYYMDYTGTGNSLNVGHPHSLQLIMDSLRYWVTEMHVDGFRFDLASTLAREFYDVDKLSAFFELVQQDPDGQPGEAHRRAVGCRPRRIPGGQLPAAVDGVERQVPRHRARLLARRGRQPRRVRLAAHRVGGPLRADARAARSRRSTS